MAEIVRIHYHYLRSEPVPVSQKGESDAGTTLAEGVKGLAETFIEAGMTWRLDGGDPFPAKPSVRRLLALRRLRSIDAELKEYRRAVTLLLQQLQAEQGQEAYSYFARLGAPLQSLLETWRSEWGGSFPW